MKKEQYTTPMLEVITLQASRLLCASTLDTEDIVFSGDIIEWEFIF